MYPHRWSLLAALLFIVPVLAERSFPVRTPGELLHKLDKSDEADKPSSFTVRSYSSAELNSSKPFRLDQNVECGRRPLFEGKNKKRIWNGYEARKGEFPSFVSLQIRMGVSKLGEPITNICGGVILTEKLILTAQHCLDGAQTVFINTGTAGHTTIGNDPNSQRIQSIHSCKAYNYVEDADDGVSYNGRRDYGIVVLQKPIKFNDEAQPACLSPEYLLNRDQVTAAGIGLTSDQPRSKSDRLWALPAENIGDCRVPFSELMCFRAYAREILGNVCQGDSGGPIYRMRNNRHHVAAVLVSGRRCNRNDIFLGLNVVTEYTQIRKLMTACLNEAPKKRVDGRRKRKRSGRPLDLV